MGQYQIPQNPAIVDIVVDMQNDFVTGSLGTNEAIKITPLVAETARKAIADGCGVLFTKDTHPSDYLNTREGRELPVEHCINGTKGWELAPAIKEVSLLLDGKTECCKPTFGDVNLPQRVKELFFPDGYVPGTVKKFRLYGVCTGICVLANAVILRSAFPETDIEILENACACVTPESHNTAIAAMRTLQFHII